MRVKRGCKLLLVCALALLAGCPLTPRVPAPTPATASTPATAPPPAAAHEGKPYDIVSADSLLIVRVYRGGALASAGHNHVIASHDLSGAIYVPADPLRSSFEVHIPVATLTVDEKELRARELSPDFPADVPESARQGTRRNMLGDALLDAAHHPEIVLRALRLTNPAAAPGQSAPATGAVTNTLLARVAVEVRGAERAVEVPVSYRLTGDALEISAQFPLRQSDLGLTPFTAMLGALAVQDEMRVSLQLLAHPAARATH
jgi:hypothetical protein